MGIWDWLEKGLGNLAGLASPATSYLNNIWILVAIGAVVILLLAWFVLIPLITTILTWAITGILMVWHTIF